MNKRIRKQNPVLILLLLLVILPANCKRDIDTPNRNNRQQNLDRLLETYDQQFREYLSAAQQTIGKEILEYSPLSDTVTIPKYMEISGSYYDYGRLVGNIARQYGQHPQHVPTSRVEFNNRVMEMYQGIYPQYLEIARGIGDVFDIPVEELDFVYLEYDFFLNLWYRLFKYDEFQKLAGPSASQSASTTTHCSMIFATVEDDIFVGRNFDDAHEKPQFVVYSKMKGGYKVMANACYVPYHWIMDGVNEKGLYMGTANLVSPPKYYWLDSYPDVPAICEHHLFRIALETCATVDDVIALYRSIRPWSANGTDHLLVADASGNSAVIEFNLDREAVFFPAEKNYQLMTNIAYQEGFDYMMENCRRFYQGTTMAEAGITGFADVENITRTIRGGNHGYSSFFDLKKRFMQVYRRSDFYTPYDFTLPTANE